MRLEDLLARLPREVIGSTRLTDPGSDVRDVSFLVGEDVRAPHEDVLYVSDQAMLVGTVASHGLVSCVVAGDGEQGCPACDQDGVNLVWLAPGSDLFACYNAVQEVFREDRRLADITQRLLAAHFSNQGLQFLVEEAANALGNPIVVVDTTYRYIASHLGDLVEDDTRLAHVMAEEIANETVLEEAVAYIRDSRIDSELARSKGPYERHNDMLDCNTMTLAVMVRGVCIAHVMMMERSRPFDDLDRKVFVRLADFVAQELQKGEVWGPTSGELGAYFLQNLLNDRSPSDAVTRRRMKALDFYPKPVLYVVCLHAPGEGLSQMQAERVAGQLRPLLHHALYTRHHQQLVLLVSRDADVGFSERAERKIREVATLNGLTAGVSNLYTSIIETRAAYAQARAAIRYGEVVSKFFDDGCLWRYASISYMQMLEMCARHQNLLDFCHPALRNLATYDAGHSGELMDTLYCYLQVAGSTARAASILSLHKNTMLYRLGRIRSLLGMDLSSGEDIFLLQMGFRVLMSLGLFKPRVQLTRKELQP